MLAELTSDFAAADSDAAFGECFRRSGDRLRALARWVAGSLATDLPRRARIVTAANGDIAAVRTSSRPRAT